MSGELFYLKGDSDPWMDAMDRGMPADIARLYDELDATSDPRERAEIEQALANREA